MWIAFILIIKIIILRTTFKLPSMTVIGYSSFTFIRSLFRMIRSRMRMLHRCVTNVLISNTTHLDFSIVHTRCSGSMTRSIIILRLRCSERKSINMAFSFYCRIIWSITNMTAIVRIVASICILCFGDSYTCIVSISLTT